MKLLLDTHVWLWLQHAPERLGSALPAVEDPSCELLLSAASAWEIAIKWKLGKLQLPEELRSYVPDRCAGNGVKPLAIATTHALAVADLPPHHADPFDRMLVAQALSEDATLVTGDDALRAYDLPLMWAR